MSELSEVQLTEFQAFRREFRHGVSYINARFDSVDVELHALRTDYSQIRTDVDELRTDVKEIRTDVNELRTDVNELRTDVNELRTDYSQLRTDVTELRTDLNDAVQAIMGGMDRIYLQIQEDLRRIENKNS